MANDEAGPIQGAQVGEKDAGRKARAAGSRKPGLFARMADRGRERVEKIRLPQADWRTFAWGLLVLIILSFIIRNWAPVRISFFGWYLDAPRAVVFAIIFLLGMVTTWVIEVRGKRIAAAQVEAAEAAARAEAEAAQAAASEDLDFDPDESPSAAAPNGEVGI